MYLAWYRTITRLLVLSPQQIADISEPSTSLTMFHPKVELLAPAVEGTLNVLKACSEAKLKRVVVVSSVGAVSFNPNWPPDKLMGEDCWSDKDYCKTTENWYCLSKTIAESEAPDYATKHGLDVVTVCPTIVLGPLLQSTLNTSSMLLVDILNGNRETMENKVCTFVDVRDVADALLLVYEKSEASGRYICAPHRTSVQDLVGMLKGMYPETDYPKKLTEAKVEPVMTSDKLRKLGWKWRPLKETLVDTVEFYKEAGVMNKNYPNPYF